MLGAKAADARASRAEGNRRRIGVPSALACDAHRGLLDRRQGSGIVLTPACARGLRPEPTLLKRRRDRMTWRSIHDGPAQPPTAAAPRSRRPVECRRERPAPPMCYRHPAESLLVARIMRIPAEPVLFSSTFVCPYEISPQRPNIRSVARGDRIPERAAIEHGGHHAGEGGSVLVMEESHEKPGLPIAHHDT
jgi:hypothetical protein